VLGVFGVGVGLCHTKTTKKSGNKDN